MDSTCQKNGESSPPIWRFEVRNFSRQTSMKWESMTLFLLESMTHRWMGAIHQSLGVTLTSYSRSPLWAGDLENFRALHRYKAQTYLLVDVKVHHQNLFGKCISICTFVHQLFSEKPKATSSKHEEFLRKLFWILSFPSTCSNSILQNTHKKNIDGNTLSVERIASSFVSYTF